MLDLSQHQRAERVNQGSTQIKQCAYKVCAIRIRVLLNEVANLSVIHPF